MFNISLKAIRASVRYLTLLPSESPPLAWRACNTNDVDFVSGHSIKQRMTLNSQASGIGAEDPDVLCPLRLARAATKIDL
jgi:hypothetical protein